MLCEELPPTLCALSEMSVMIFNQRFIKLSLPCDTVSLIVPGFFSSCTTSSCDMPSNCMSLMLRIWSPICRKCNIFILSLFTNHWQFKVRSVNLLPSTSLENLPLYSLSNLFRSQFSFILKCFQILIYCTIQGFNHMTN